MIKLTNILQATLFVICVSITGCISYDSVLLVPSITMSAEDVILQKTGSENSTQLNFGLDVGLNESDSLVNVEILPGVRVRDTTINGPAYLAGIQAGDVILSVNDMETDHPDALLALQSQIDDQTEFTFKVRRNTIVFEQNSPARELYRADPLATRAGYVTELVTIRGQTKVAAARVTEFFPDSPLPGAGINIGDLVLAVNGAIVKSAQGLITKLNRDYELGEQVQFSIFDGQEIRIAPIKLWEPGSRISRVSLGPLLQYNSSLSSKSSRLSLLDFWLFAVYSYNRNEGERAHSLFGFLNFTSDYGELVEDQD
jgi:predicted metalloprotease with PDZ domain